MTIHKNHLKEAREYSRLTESKWFYFKHMFWGLQFAFVLLTWSIAMLIHAVIPQLVGFTVLERLVKFLKEMKQKHPDDPLLSKIEFND